MAIHKSYSVCRIVNTIDWQSILAPEQTVEIPEGFFFQITKYKCFSCSRLIIITNEIQTMKLWFKKIKYWTNTLILAVAVTTWSHWATCWCTSTEPVYHGKDWRYEWRPPLTRVCGLVWFCWISADIKRISWHTLWVPGFVTLVPSLLHPEQPRLHEGVQAV